LLGDFRNGGQLDLQLEADERQFLAAASDVIMANPFEIDRRQVAALVPASALAIPNGPSRPDHAVSGVDCRDSTA
jgi:hypothetical protein